MNRLNLITLIATMSMILFIPSLHAVELSDGEKKFLNADFQILKSLKELPESIQNYITKHVKNAISPIDGPFRATDVVSDPNIPVRRLLLAGTDGNLSFVWYEHGGRGYHHHVVVMEKNLKGVDLVYAVREYFEENDIYEIQKVVSSGILNEETLDVQKYEYW